MNLLEDILEAKIQLPAHRISSMEELLTEIPDLKRHIVDATEQPINRPKYNQKFYYSGKKKKHTIKRQIVITPDKKLVGISMTVEGKRHDKKLADDSNYLAHAPPDTRRLADTGYIDSDTDKLWGITTIHPHKKSYKRELSESQKIFNKNLSSIRVRVEHVIGHMKYNRIFSDKVRYRKIDHNQVANIVGGLYNFKLGY